MARRRTNASARVAALAVAALLPLVAPAWCAADAISPRDGRGRAGPDSLAWTASDSALGAVVDHAPVSDSEQVSGTMGWFAATALGRTAAGQLFAKGGNFMWPLLGFAIVTLAVILERAWTLSRARTNTRRLIGAIITSLRNDGVTAAAQVCERTRGPIAAILHSGLLRADRGPQAVEKAIETAGTIELSFLERGLLALSASANISPLIGFLGTVSGMIHAFEAIAQADQVSPRLVASGISEALITTLAGLSIAIPASIFHSFFLSVIDRFIIEMEESAAELVEELSQTRG